MSLQTDGGVCNAVPVAHKDHLQMEGYGNLP